MSEEEFNLSERFKQFANCEGGVYREEDVKEFIRKLKEKIRSSLNFTPIILKRDRDILKIIDKLLGDKLI